MRTIFDTNKATLQKLPINPVKVNFGLGLMVLLIRDFIQFFKVIHVL